MLAAVRGLPESLSETAARNSPRRGSTNWRALTATLAPLLALAFAGQFVLTMFEGTLALFAQAKFDFGPQDVGYGFMVCGLVMTVFQVGAVGFLAGKVSEMMQIGAGFGLVGAGVTLLAAAESRFLVFTLIALLSLGMALILPNLSAVISKRGGDQQAGASLGIQNAANSLGQAGGPVLGGGAFHLANRRCVFVCGSIVSGSRFGDRLDIDGSPACSAPRKGSEEMKVRLFP